MYFFQIFPNFCVEFYAKIIKNSTNVFNLMLDRWRSQATAFELSSGNHRAISKYPLMFPSTIWHNQTTAIFESFGHFYETLMNNLSIQTIFEAGKTC